MLAYPAALLNLELIILDPLPNAPSKQVLNHPEHLTGSFMDPQPIADLASKVDILSVEIEHVNTDALEAAQNMHTGRSVEVQPAPSTLRTIQDKFIQKQWLEGRSIPVAPFQSVDGIDSAVFAAGEQLGYPFMLKTRKLAYDGRGNFVVRSRDDATDALKTLGCGNGESAMLYAEKWVPFTKEVAVMVVRGKDGEVRSYPPVETIHRNSVCHLVFAPLRAVDSQVCVPPNHLISFETSPPYFMYDLLCVAGHSPIDLATSQGAGGESSCDLRGSRRFRSRDVSN
jgi:phosphoribosylaminoimidazole carboxylase